MDLDLWDCFGRKKLCLITEEIRYLESQTRKLDNLPKSDYMYLLNSIALRKAKIVYNLGLSECNRVNISLLVTGETKKLSPQSVEMSWGDATTHSSCYRLIIRCIVR